MDTHVDGLAVRVRLAPVQAHRAEIAGAQIGLLGGEQLVVAERLAAVELQIGAAQPFVDLIVAGQGDVAETVAGAAVHLQHHPCFTAVAVHLQTVAGEGALGVTPVDQ